MNYIFTHTPSTRNNRESSYSDESNEQLTLCTNKG